MGKDTLEKMAELELRSHNPVRRSCQQKKKDHSFNSVTYTDKKFPTWSPVNHKKEPIIKDEK